MEGGEFFLGFLGRTFLWASSVRACGRRSFGCVPPPPALHEGGGGGTGKWRAYRNGGEIRATKEEDFLLFEWAIPIFQEDS